MDDIKQFAKDEKKPGNSQLEYTIRVYSQGIGMEFSIEKCTWLVTKSGKRHLTDGMELINQDKIRKSGEKKKRTNT